MDIHLWLTHVVHQKPTGHCKSTILHLKISFKKRIEHTHTHTLTHSHTHTHTHTPPIRGTPHPVLTSPQDGMHAQALATIAELPKAPHLHYTARASQTHPGTPLADTGIIFSHYHHSSRPPTWTPSTTSSHTLVCMHTRVTVTHTDSHTHAQSKQFWPHIWIPAHTQNSHPCTQIL